MIGRTSPSQSGFLSLVNSTDLIWIVTLLKCEFKWSKKLCSIKKNHKPPSIHEKKEYHKGHLMAANWRSFGVFMLIYQKQPFKTHYTRFIYIYRKVLGLIKTWITAQSLSKSGTPVDHLLPMQIKETVSLGLQKSRNDQRNITKKKKK